MKKNRNKAIRKDSSNGSLLDSLASILKVIFSFLANLLTNLPGKVKRYILSFSMFLLALISFLSFFGLAGSGGNVLKNLLFNFTGQAVYLAPFIFIVFGIIFLLVPRKHLFAGFLGIFSCLAGTIGVLELLDMPFLSGGAIGRLETTPLVNIFGELVSFFVFFALIIVGLLILGNVFSREKDEKKGENGLIQSMKQALDPSRFKVLKVEPERSISVAEATKPETVSAEGAKPRISRKSLPPIELLEEEKEKAQPGDIKNNMLIIKKTLEDFDIEVQMAEVNIGPTVTQYTLKPPEGVKLSKITGLSNNLSLALSAHPIRIEAPIPGRPLVGVEVPNSTRSKVRLRGLIGHPDFRKKYSRLGFVLGRDVAGNPVFSELSRLPHLLVAGATGTGKTVFLNSLILSLLYQNSPDNLRFVLIDPKRVEFSIYRDLPHLLCPVVCDANQSVNALAWLIGEMERRFKKLAEYNTRDITSFNEKASKNGEEPLYYIVLIIDELADLMVAKGREMETKIVRIAQMARAVGIHLVLATQRPSTEVITGLIKTNITCRVSFQLPTQIDSRTVLDMAGAEKLLGAGDLLYISAEVSKPRRIQGAYVSEEEVKRVGDWIKEEIGTYSILENDLSRDLEDYLANSAPQVEGMEGDMQNDSLYGQAKEIVIRTRKASASFLQRRLQIGYVRAARLLDMLEMDGVIGPSEGAKPRKVFSRAEGEVNQEEPYENDYEEDEEGEEE